MKLHFKIISTVAVALVILSGVILSFIEISCGLDIFKISDLAEYIGYEHIARVTVDGDYVNIKLKQSSLLDGDEYDVKKDIEKIKKLSTYINSNERYKEMRIKIQYGEDGYDAEMFSYKPVITVANYSLAGKSEERYDGLYSVKFFYYPMPADTSYIIDDFLKDVRELQYINTIFPNNVEPLKAFTRLEYLYFEKWNYEETHALLKEYLPRCEIECDIYSSANQQE